MGLLNRVTKFTIQDGDKVECVNDDQHCHFLQVGWRYTVDGVFQDDQGAVLLCLRGMARLWPATQFKKVEG